MQTHFILRGLVRVLVLALWTALPTLNYATTIYQSSGGSYIAFEGESIASIASGTPTSWVVTNDATANGGKALYQAGANQTGSASSFAYYSLNFSQSGTYFLYYRWRADKTYTD